MTWIVALALILLYLAYRLGLSEGLVRANRSAIQRGAWVEFIKDVKVPPFGSRPQLKVRSGTQGIVRGVDKWGQFSVWVAEPWAHLYDGERMIYNVEDLASVRTKPLLAVSESLREETLGSLEQYEEETHETMSRILNLPDSD